MKTRASIRPACRPPRRAGRCAIPGRAPAREPAATPRAFTLVEMIVVISIIILVASIALPSFIGMLDAGADSGAYNILSAQFSAARALAIERYTYAGVHIQRADATNPRAGLPKLNVCYTAIMILDTDGNFVSSPGFQPRRMPGHMGFGDTSKPISDAKFTTMTVVFTPQGSLATNIPNVSGGNVSFYRYDPLFGTDANIVLWDHSAANNDPPCKVLRMFDLAEFDSRDAGGKTALLNETSQIIPINVYTGLLFPRK